MGYIQVFVHFNDHCMYIKREKLLIIKKKQKELERMNELKKRIKESEKKSFKKKEKKENEQMNG